MDPAYDIAGYVHQDGELNASHEYLLPALMTILASLNLGERERRVFELGCGNGAVANELTNLGYAVTGVDPSQQGLAQARQHYAHLKLREGSAYDELWERYGQFPVVVSLEVIEHVYFPRKFAATVFNLVDAGGTAIISTPYHGYWKNLALAVSGQTDRHHTALWDHGHIKFWSMKTLRVLLEESGFHPIAFLRVGRIPALAKSMIAIARKPKS